MNKLNNKYSQSDVIISDKSNVAFTSVLQKQFDLQSLISNSLNNSYLELKETIVGPTGSFTENLNELFQENINKFKDLINKAKNMKKELNTKKQKYYDESDQLIENEEKGRTDVIVSQKEKANQAYEEYKAKVNEINEYYKEIEKEYTSLKVKNKDIEDTILSFVKEICVKITSIQVNSISPQIESPFTSFTIGRNLQEEENKAPLIPEEKIIEYEEYRKDNPKLLKKINNYFSSAAFAFQIASGLDLYSPIEEFSEIDNTQQEEIVPEKDQNETTDAVIKYIFSKEDIPEDIRKETKEKIEKDSFISLLMDKYIKSNYSSFFYIENKNNFEFMKDIMYLYLEKASLDINQPLIVQRVINTCERTYTKNPYTYLCCNLIANPFITSKSNWELLLEDRMIQKLNMKTKEYLKIQNKKNSKQGLFSTFTNYFMNESLENSIIADLGLDASISKYTSLSREHKEKLENDFNTIIHNTFKEFIEHLCNYNWKKRDILELIVQMASKFNLSEEEINFFVIYTTSSFLGIRRTLKNDNNELKKKIKNIINKRITAIEAKYPLDMKSERETIYVIRQSSTYLPKSEYINLFTLNKTLSKKIKYDFYLKNLLDDNMNITDENKETYMNKRLSIWKSILEISTFTRDFDYRKSLEEARTSISEHNLKLIELDAMRTHFHSNEEENRKLIVNLLISISYVNPEIKYYQGMNYIAAFLVVLSKDEAVAFSLLYSLLTNSQFKFLFGKNLQQLKNYFFVFERLLRIYLPSVYYYFSKHSVSVHYYMTPWLITLFTNVIQYNKNEIPLIVLNIWDEFLIKGWKALFTSIIALISIHIEEIESKNGDMLLSFLINDLSKSEKFSDENYSKWIEEKKKFKIKNKDITNIEGEIKYEYNDNKTIDYLFNKN